MVVLPPRPSPDLAHRPRGQRRQLLAPALAAPGRSFNGATLCGANYLGGHRRAAWPACYGAPPSNSGTLAPETFNGNLVARQAR
jgi:hypothetical protein